MKAYINIFCFFLVEMPEDKRKEERRQEGKKARKRDTKTERINK